MSGPKISVYSLTGRARSIVAGQISCEQQSLVCAAQIRSLLSECSGMGRDLEDSLAMLELLQKRRGGQEDKIEEVRSARRGMDQELKRLRDEFRRGRPRASSRYEITEEALEAKKRELEKITALKNEALSLRDTLKKAAEAGRGAIKKERDKAHQTIAEYLAGGEDDASGAPAERDPAKLAADISGDIGAVLSFDITDGPEESTGSDGRKEAEASADADVRKKEEANAGSDVLKNEEAYIEALLRYQMLCEITGVPEAERKSAFANAREIEEAAAALEQKAVKQKEQSYIAECVDEVMRDMGYDLIGRRQVRKKSGRQFRNELYRFDEGTAVNITYSSEGQISMELGGIAREDRIPTADETEVLTREMEAFCGEFSEFERRMAAKGVIVGNRIALMQPAAEYAAIINVNDYDLEAEAGRQITEMNAAVKRRKKGGARKAMKEGEA